MKMSCRNSIHVDGEVFFAEIIDNLKEFEKIKEDWTRLYNLKSDCSIFFSFSVFKIYFEVLSHHFSDVEMKIFVIRNEEQIIGIFPLTYEKRRFLRFFSLKDLSLNESNRISFYYFLLDPNTNHETIFQIFVTALKKESRMWDILKFFCIPEQEVLFNDFVTIIKKHFSINIKESETLVLDCTVADTNSKLYGSCHRKNGVKKKIRRLQKIGTVKMLKISDKNDLLPAYDEFIDIEDRNWKGLNNSSLKKNRYQREFYKKLATFLSIEGKINIYFLEVDRKKISGLYTIQDKNICYLVKTGYDDAYSSYSPSNILLCYLYESLSSNETVDKIDFLGPYYSHQRRYGKTTRRRYDLYIYNNKFYIKFGLYLKSFLYRVIKRE